MRAFRFASIHPNLIYHRALEETIESADQLLEKAGPSKKSLMIRAQRAYEVWVLQPIIQESIAAIGDCLLILEDMVWIYATFECPFLTLSLPIQPHEIIRRANLDRTNPEDFEEDFAQSVPALHEAINQFLGPMRTNDFNDVDNVDFPPLVDWATDAVEKAGSPNDFSDFPEEYRNAILSQYSPKDDTLTLLYLPDCNITLLNHGRSASDKIRIALLICIILKCFPRFPPKTRIWLASILFLELMQQGFYREGVEVGQWLRKSYEDLHHYSDEYREQHIITLLNLAHAHWLCDTELDQELAIDSVAEACSFATSYLESRMNTKRKELWACAMFGSAHLVLRVQAIVGQAASNVEKTVGELDQVLEVYTELVLAVKRWTAMLFPEDDSKENQEEGESAEEDAVEEEAKDENELFGGRGGKRLRGVAKLFHDQARAAHLAGESCIFANKFEEGLQNEEAALSTLHVFSEIFPDYMPHLHAEALQRVIQSNMSDVIDKERALYFADQAVTAFLPLYLKSSSFALGMYNSLWECGMMLSTTMEYEKTKNVWLAMEQVARDGLQDPLYLGDAHRQLGWVMRRLENREEACRHRRACVDIYHEWLKPTMTKHEADALYELSVDLFLSQRLQEAYDVQNKALAAYKALRNREDSATLTQCYANTLTYMATCHIHFKAFDDALDLAYESYLSFKSIEDKDKEATLANYLFCLRILANAAFQSSNEDKAIELTKEVMAAIREAYDRNPKEVLASYIEALSAHIITFTKFNKLNEAIEASEEAVKWYSCLFEAAESKSEEEGGSTLSVDVVTSYFECLINYGEDLCSVGRFDRAMEVLDQAIKHGETHFKPGELDSGVPLLVAAKHNKAEIHLEFGRWDKALEIARETLVFIEANGEVGHDMSTRPGALMFQSHSVSLMVQAMALHRLGRYEEALEMGEKCRQFTSEAPLKVVARNNMFAPLLLPRCLAGLSETFADLGHEEKATDLARESVDLFKQVVAQYYIAGSFTEVIGGYCVFQLAERLGATGELEKIHEAISLLEDILPSYRKSIEVKVGNLPHLVPNLRLLAILCCAAGNHDRAKAVWEELEVIMNGGIHPQHWPVFKELVTVQVRKDGPRRLGRQKFLGAVNIDCSCQQPTLMNV